MAGMSAPRRGAIRKAFRMSINDGQGAEYERRHNPIWHDLRETLVRHGVRTYSIFLDPASDDLFAYVEVDSEAEWAAIAGTDVCRRWWHFMRDVMPANADDSPVARDLREVFHLEHEGTEVTEQTV
jgi:L-rhamnose mutarotase